MKTFDELRESYRKPTQAEIDADRRKGGKSKDTSSRYKNMKKKVYGNMMGSLKKEENDLDEAVSKVKTTMPDKVASSAIRFGLKSKSQGGSVSISGPKGKLNDFLRAIIGRSSYGNASELDEAKLSDMEIHNKLANRNLLIKAIKTAEKMGGNMTGAVREIEKMKKGLSKHKAVQAALRQANESVDQTDEILEESDTFHVKVGDGRDHMIVKTKAKNSREAVKKIKSQYPKDRVSLYRESVDLDENYRTLATHGMGAETKNTINVGRDVDYYEPKNGDKRQGRITKVTRSGYVVKDENDGKSHTFAFHDRAKAKEIMAKSK